MGVRIDNHTDEVRERLEIAIERGLQACGLIAEDYARALCPRDTGNLMDHILSQVDGHECQIGVSAMTPPYGIYVEFGTGQYAETGGRQTPWVYQASDGKFYTTKGQKPQPFIRPAAEQHTAEYNSILEESIRNA